MATVLNDTGVIFPDGSTQISSSLDALANSQTFTSTGIFTIPAGVTSVRVTMIGGGGNGGSGGQYVSGNTTFYNGGGGGGSGAVVFSYKLTVVPLTPYTVTVGSATLPSSFGALLSVNAGASGASGAGGVTGGAGGLGISIPLSATQVLSYNGDRGSNGTTSSNVNSAPGGQGGTTPYFNRPGGAGGSASGGVGAAATANTGAGGGGGGRNAGGGSGGSGLVIVQW